MSILIDFSALSVEFQDDFRNLQGSLRTAARENLAQRIFDWLSGPDPSSNYENAREKRSQGTGIWLLENPAFVDWKSSPCSLLWLYGKPGSGKTVLSSTAIHFLLSNIAIKERVAYFYFDFQNNEKQKVKNFLRSIIAQLFDCNEETLKVAEQFYNDNSHGRTTPSIQSSKAAIRQLIDKLPSVYFVIDALDECNDRVSLLECFEDFCSWRQDSLHILATSRQETDIEECFLVIANCKLSLEDSVIDEDILRYVRYQLNHDKKLSKWSEELRTEIEKALLEGAQGMFRWVECQLQAIRGCLRPVNLRKTLKSLPKTLDETYARMLDAVDEDYIEDVRRILSCLVYSFYPLSVQEIADTVAIVSSDEIFYDINYRLRDSRDVFTMCPGLIITTRSIRTTHIGDRHMPIDELRLAHYSVKEYLVSGRLSSPRLSNFILESSLTHETLTRLCIRYLLWCHEEHFCDDSEFLLKYAMLYLGKAAFAPYAAACWSRHLQAACLDRSSPLYEDSMKLLTNPTILRDIVKLHPPWFRHAEVIVMERLGYVKTINGNYYLDQGFENVPPLYYASLQGIDELVVMLLDQGEDANCSASEGTCLSAAAARGHSSTVQLLIEQGAMIDTVVQQKSQKGETYFSRSAIHEAVYGQHAGLAEMLLAKGADVNMSRLPKGEVCGEIQLNTPLQTALVYHPMDFIPLLIRAGADPNAAGGTSGTALEIASRRGTDDDSIGKIVMLLDAGADPNLTSDKQGLRTPLFEMILDKQPRGVQLLIDYGVSSQSIDSRIIPFILSTYLSDKISFHWAMKTVMQIRPDVGMEIPLVAAAKYGYAEIVDFLLRAGISANSRESSGTPVLHAAAFTPEGGNDLIERLLDASADIDIDGPPFASALQAAALAGKAAVVKLLLERGASIDCSEGEYGSALRIARDRLEDWKAGLPGTWVSHTRIEDFGPHDYFGGKDYIGSRTIRIKRTGKGVRPTIDIPHTQNADYQAVIDILLARGAMHG